MNELKDFLYSLTKAFFKYRAGFKYIYYRYIVARRILQWEHSLERDITHKDFSVHMLTCHRDIIIAAWSLASFYSVSNVIGKLTIHDDGTLTHEDYMILHRLFPSASIVNTKDFFSRHGTALAKFPVLSKFRKDYKKFQAKKLIDVFFERKGDMILYLDSDMLWFQNPIEISTAVAQGVRDVSYMMSNGPDKIHVTFRGGTRTSDFVAECNSGVTLYHVNNYNLDEVSSYVEKCDYMNRKFTDQACFGTVLKYVRILPRETYFIKGAITERTVMRHYTGPSREKFYFYGVSFLHDKILGKR